MTMFIYICVCIYICFIIYSRLNYAWQLGSWRRKGTKQKRRKQPSYLWQKNGVKETVEKILELFPAAVHDMNTDKKKIVLLAVANKQPHEHQRLLKRSILKDTVFRKSDRGGSRALQVAATLGDCIPWLITSPALQTQREIKWYKVRNILIHTYPNSNTCLHGI